MRGGARQGAGRKLGSCLHDDDRRTLLKQVRWSPKEWARVEQLAAAAKMSAGKYIRSKTLGA